MTSAPPALRILLVEASPLDTELLVEALRLTGRAMSIQHAPNGEAALRHAADRPDLILLAAHLPGMDGFEVLKQLKANPQTQSVPVLVMGVIWAAEIQRAIDLQADGVLHQGASFADLEKLAREVLRFTRRSGDPANG